VAAACSVGLSILHMVELCAILTVVFLGGEPAMRVVTLEEARGQLNDLLALVLQGEKVFIRTEQGWCNSLPCQQWVRASSAVPAAWSRWVRISRLRLRIFFPTCHDDAP